MKKAVVKRGGEYLGKIPYPKLAPSLLSADFRRLGEEVRRVEEAGADALHFDIADGHFVPNITFGPMVIRALRDETDLPFYVHLMVDNPEAIIEDVVDAGGDVVTFHIEVSKQAHRMIRSLRDRGIKAGIALCPETPLSSMEWIIDEVDVILIMGVDPGFGGQTFIPSMLKKIEKTREMLDSRPEVDIAIDGGVTLQNVNSIVEAGASLIIAGTATFGQGDIREAIKKLKAEMERAYYEKWHKVDRILKDGK
ncbi:MAG: ribulose-phosphate 3-epimerase [Nitrososphaerota archaeon]|nr:ribulose-phosphate 3-epimerase [Nitrososphaerota archaeon]